MKSEKFLILIYLFVFCSTMNATFHKIGHCDGPYWGLDMALKDNTLLIPDDAGIHIIDIDVHTNPIYVGCLEILDSCREIEIAGDIAYIANRSDGLLVLDVSNPHLPQVIGSIDTPDCALSIAISNSVVYIADRHSGLQIIDVSNPNSPMLLSSYNTSNANHVAVSDTLVFVSNFLGNVQVFDVSNPGNPTLINTLYSNSIEQINDMKIDGSFAYFAAGSFGLEIYNIENPLDINLETVYDTQYANGISIKDEKLYLTEGYSGLQVLDISNPLYPNKLGKLDSPVCASYAIVNQNIAYIADLYTGLEVYDISDPVIPEQISSVDTPHYALSMQIRDNFGYVADNNSYLQIIDFNDINQISIANYYGVSGSIKDLKIINDTCYLVTSNKLYILRLTDPTHPIIESQIDLGSINYAVDYFNQHVFIATGSGLEIVNVSNSAMPYKVSECNTNNIAFDLVAIGHYVYLAVKESGLVIVDINDISNPVLIQHFGTKIYATALAKKNNIIYLSVKNEGIHIIDVFDPENPIYLDCLSGNHDDSKFFSAPYLFDDFLFFQDNSWNEIFIYDVFDPDNPIPLNCFPWNISTNSFTFYNDYLITLNKYHGIHVLDLENITFSSEQEIISPEIQLSNYPNPFNPSTTIEFSIEQNEQVEIIIYNQKGQKVKSFSHAELVEACGIPNSYSVVWNGNDENNKPVSSGVYFYKLKVGNETKAAGKCLLLK
ncbi:MAG: hypothetical protein K9N09_09170 [Candidatus Cloacimonetes bacterium]|nr:hypothetical protein [Candidatus Cloacimonadota bacterium]MCF7814193.1 hypothetical protein [Candidatus Cloacimonadota bacterium]MCF7868858.1 hypothetical protein [Candidatus Cloacimonadota bacterium]MCF7884249.1 hypothetical protein [Candidatus Cloacimonadota bacterium]